MEDARWCEEAKRQRQIDEVWSWMEQVQQEDLQVWAQAIMATQGGRTPGSLMAVVGPIVRACKWCTLHLMDTEGCMVSEKGKVWACMPCQKVRKACIWPSGLGDATMAMGSGTEGSGKPAPKWMRKRPQRAMTNMPPRGEEKHKKACMTMEEGEEDDNTKEVFGVLRVMVEEQMDALGMLTQTLAQVAEKLAAMEAQDEERLVMEWEQMEIWRVHLVITRRAADCDKERLELEQVRTLLGQQWTEDLWQMGTLMWSPFIYLSKGKGKEVKVEDGMEEKGDKADNEDEDVQREEE